MNLFYIRLIISFYLFFNAYSIVAKKVLVTGGAGFIGSHVAQALLNRGDDVVIVDNFNDSYSVAIKQYNIQNIQNNITKKQLCVYRVDICDTEKMTAIFDTERPDVICHLAARAGVRTSVQDPYECYRTNNMGTVVVFELARKCGVKHIVNASSSSIYDSRQGGAFVETDSVNKQTSPYGVTKRAGELLAYVYTHLYDISITNLRFFSVYGPRGRVDMAPFIFMDALYHDRPIKVYGDGTIVRDFTYIEDIVDGVIKAIDNPLGYQIFNIGRGEPIRLTDFIEAMEIVMGKRANIEYKEGYSCDAPFTHANIDKACNMLGYQPKTSVVVGLQKMYQWYKEEYLPLDLEKKRNNFFNNLEVECFIE